MPWLLTSRPWSMESMALRHQPGVVNSRRTTRCRCPGGAVKSGLNDNDNSIGSLNVTFLSMHNIHTIPIYPIYPKIIGLYDSLKSWSWSIHILKYIKRVGAPGGSFRPPRQEPHQSPSLRHQQWQYYSYSCCNGQGLHVALLDLAEAIYRLFLDEKGTAQTITNIH